MEQLINILIASGVIVVIAALAGVLLALAERFLLTELLFRGIRFFHYSCFAG